MSTMGTNHKYQCFIVLLTLLISVSVGFVVILISYVDPDPIFECLDNNNVFNTCLEVDACSLIEKGGGARVRFQPDSWTEKYKLGCGSSGKRTAAMMTLLFINGLGPIPALYLSDLYGRKIGLWICFGYSILGFMILAFLDVYFLKMVGLGIWNAGAVTYTSLLPIIITECTDSRSPIRGITVGLYFVGYGMGCTLINLFAYISASADFLVLITCSYFLPAGLVALALSESPMFELDRGNIEEFEHLIQKIGQTNGESPTESLNYTENMDKLRSVSQDYREMQCQEMKKNRLLKYPILVILFSKELQKKCLVLMVIACYYYFVYFGLSTNVEGLGTSDIKVNGIIFGLSQTIGSGLIVPFAHKMKRKRWILIFESAMIGGAVALLVLSLLWNINDASLQIGQAVLCNVVAASMSAFIPFFFLQVSESFPPELRASANSLVFNIANTLSLFSPYFGELATNLHLHFVVGCSALGIISLPLSLTLTETLRD